MASQFAPVILTLLATLALVLPGVAEFLGQYKDQAVVALSGAVIVFIEAQLNLFPQYEALINAGLIFIVAVHVSK